MRPGDKPTPPRCLLGRIQPLQMDTEEIKRAAWVEQGMLVLSLRDARLRWDEAMYLKQIGDRIYGAK